MLAIAPAVVVCWDDPIRPRLTSKYLKGVYFKSDKWRINPWKKSGYSGRVYIYYMYIKVFSKIFQDFLKIVQLKLNRKLKNDFWL